MAPEKVLKALEDLQQNSPNADAEAMRFAISVSELQFDTGKHALHNDLCCFWALHMHHMLAIHLGASLSRAKTATA